MGQLDRSSLFGTLIACLLSGAFVFLPVLFVAIAVYLFVAGIEAFATRQLGMAAYLWVGLILPVSVGALCHGIAVAGLRLVNLGPAYLAALVLSPLMPFVSASTGWDHYTAEFPIPLGIATVAYGVACAWGPGLVAYAQSK